MTDIDLSVILITASTYERIAKTIRRLAAQEIADRIQLVIVHQAENPPEVIPEDLESFGEVILFPTGTFQSTGDPRADAVSVAKGPVTVFAEDHCFPEPGWAQALVRAHSGGHGAVGPSMRNANPKTLLSWVDMCLNFGPSVQRDNSEETSLLCWHNTSYPTQLLLDQEDLGSLLEAEGVFYRRLEEMGRSLYREASAHVTHTNISGLRGFILGQFWGTRLFWATLTSVEGWSWPKRLLFALASPAVGARRFLRASQDLGRTNPGHSLAALPYLALGTTILTGGIVAGSLFGAGNCMTYRLSLEFERERYLAEGEEQIIFV